MNAQNIEKKIHEVKETVDNHHNTSVQFYNEMRINTKDFREQLGEFSKDLTLFRSHLDDVIKRVDILEEKDDKQYRQNIKTNTIMIVMGILVLILYLQ